MQIISISLDRSILKENSPAFLRMIEYAEMTGKMHIICYSPRKDFHVIQKGKLMIYPTNSLTKVHFILDAYKIGKKIIKKEVLSPDHAVITTQDPFETGLVGFLLKKKFGLGLNIQDHGNFFESSYFSHESYLNRLRLILGGFLIKNADSIRTVSSREKNLLIKQKKIPAQKIINFPIFTDWKSIQSKPIKTNIKKKYLNYKYYLVTICRLEKVKNLSLLIDAFEKVLQQKPNGLLLIIGDGSLKKHIVNKINHKKLSKNIILEDWTNDPFSYYKSADLFVLSSFSEGFPRTIIESAACGCPIVMTNVGSANEFIFNQKNGWIVKNNDISSMADAMLEAIQNKQKRIFLAQEAVSDLKKLLSLEETQSLLKESWKKALRPLI